MTIIQLYSKFKIGDPVRIADMALRSGPCIVPGVLAGKEGIFRGYWHGEEDGNRYSNVEIDGVITQIMTKRLRKL